MNVVSTAILAASISCAWASAGIADNTFDKTPFHTINDAFNAAAAARDPDAMLSLYSNDTIWMAPNAPKAQGLDTPRATYEFVFGNDATLSHTLDDVMMSDDGSLAVMIGNFDFSAPSLNLADTGTYLFVLSTENGEWKIVADMFNSDQPAQ